MKTKLALAPMAGVTDKAFRQICLEWGADITWSEMVSAEGLVRNPLENNKSLELAQPTKKELSSEYWVQIFGSDPVSMAKAASIVEKEIKPHGIDINLGCPVPKAVKSGYGVIQLKDIKKVLEIIKIIKKSIKLPLSVKTRLGIKTPEEILNFAPQLEKSGTNQIVIHARTHKEMFTGEPHWEIVKKLKEKLKIPLIYNGGINSPEKALFYQKSTGCPTLMIGQATIGKPWIFKQIKYYLETGKHWTPSEKEIKKTILTHAKLAFEFYGKGGIVSFRKHLAAYLRGAINAASLRSLAVKVESQKEIKDILKQARWKN